MTEKTRPVRVPDLIRKKKRGEKITMLTAYDASMARLLDHSGIDVLLVGDSLGMVVLGYDTTIPVTLDAMIHHSRAVSRGAGHALVIADLPFLTYQVSPRQALRNAGRLIQEGGVAAVKLEGGAALAPTVERIAEAGIPVMGHIGLLPQSVHRLGGFRRVGETGAETARLMEDARALERSGAFAVVLECIPSRVAAAVTAELKIPTIGIGSGPHCDGQVLVCYDAFGLTCDMAPPFVRKYAQLGSEMVRAAQEYIADVREGRFPAEPQATGGTE